MSKYIKLDDAIGIITEHQGIRGDTFKALHNAYAVDIVRCQDCRHRYMDADLQVWTCTYGLMIKPDGFCNYGEVRDE